MEGIIWLQISPRIHVVVLNLIISFNSVTMSQEIILGIIAQELLIRSPQQDDLMISFHFSTMIFKFGRLLLVFVVPFQSYFPARHTDRPTDGPRFRINLPSKQNETAGEKNEAIIITSSNDRQRDPSKRTTVRSKPPPPPSSSLSSSLEPAGPMCPSSYLACPARA